MRWEIAASRLFARVLIDRPDHFARPVPVRVRSSARGREHILHREPRHVTIREREEAALAVPRREPLPIRFDSTKRTRRESVRLAALRLVVLVIVGRHLTRSHALLSED